MLNSKQHCKWGYLRYWEQLRLKFDLLRFWRWKETIYLWTICGIGTLGNFEGTGHGLAGQNNIFFRTLRYHIPILSPAPLLLFSASLFMQDKIHKDSIYQIVKTCCPKSSLAWHANIRCHNCNMLILGIRYNCDQMAFQVCFHFWWISLFITNESYSALLHTMPI